MGLTIHWRLKASGTEEKARQMVTSLRQAALDLPFKYVGELVEVTGDACNADNYKREHPLRDILRAGIQWVKYDHCKGSRQCDCQFAEIRPTHLIAFITHPGDGCESASFGLCRYPAFVEVSPQRRIPTQLGGFWRWSQFCKTQYASNPTCGGMENFIRCHLTVVALLDKAAASGLDVKVTDEGEFWTTRSLPELVREVGNMNEVIAGLFGALQSAAGSGVQGEIQKFPNFEHLEAHGLAKPELAWLRRLFAATGANLR